MADLGERRITGDDILSEILRNSEAGTFRIRRTALVPCVFAVYLHPDDYNPLRPVLRHIREEIRKALTEALAQWNRGGKPSLFAKYLSGDAQQAAVYKILEKDWTIDLHPDIENRLQPGDIEVYSELGVDAAGEYGAGAMTALITKTGPSGRTSKRVDAGAQADRPKRAYAYLRYDRDGIDERLEIAKDSVAIGRGGTSYWVDLKISGPPDISREHCRIRRDPATNRFFLKDVSQFGVTINGKVIPPSLERSSGGDRDKDIEVELPHGARIGLAGVAYLDFEVASG